MDKLNTKYSNEQTLSAFIFEPKDLVPFATAWSWQRRWQKSLLKSTETAQAVWLLQHPYCYTLGRGASEEHLLFGSSNSSFESFRIDRGGEVTHHVPGQLVVYPVLDLRRYKTDLNWYLRQLEQVIIDVLRELGLPGKRLDGLTGVWLEGRKVGSIGVGCRRWVTQHGMALNIDCDLNGFNEIVPCGLKNHRVGRLVEWIPGLTVGEVQPLIKRRLINHFGLILVHK